MCPEEGSLVSLWDNEGGVDNQRPPVDRPFCLPDGPYSTLKHLNIETFINLYIQTFIHPDNETFSQRHTQTLPLCYMIVNVYRCSFSPTHAAWAAQS